MHVRLFLTLGLGVAMASPCTAQQPERWQITLANSVMLWNVALLRLAADSLIVRHADTTASVAVRDITELRLARASDDAPGAPSGEQVYQLPVWDVDQKRRMIQQILRGRGAAETAPRGRSP